MLSSSAVMFSTDSAAPHKLHDNANKIPFEWLCKVLDKIEKTDGNEQKVKVLFSRDLEKRLAGQSHWPILRLVLPGSDDCRNDYRITDRTLSDWYVEVLGLGSNANHITHWIKYKLRGEPMVLGECIEKAIKAKFAKNRLYNNDFTVGDANTLLDRLSPPKHYFKFFGPKADDSTNTDKKEVIRNMVYLNMLSPQAHKWIVRIILAASGTTVSSLQIGVDVASILDKIPTNGNARTNFDVHGDLRRAIEDRIAELEFGEPLSPMLAKTVAQKKGEGIITAVEAEMQSDDKSRPPFIMDKKIDGERLIVQVKRSEGGNRVSAFSRNGNDNSLLYARLLEDIMQRLDATVSGAMLDGECVVWDRETKKAESYDENVNMSWIESTLGLPRIDHDWFTEKDQRKRRRAVNHMYKRYGMQWGEKKAAKSVGSDNEDSDEEAARKAKSRLRPPPKDGRSTGSWHVSTARYRLKFIAFDLFWIDGLSQKIVDACALRVPGLYGVSLRPDLDLKHRGCIMHWPLALRREILRVIIQPDVHRFELIDHKIVKSVDCEERKDQIDEYFDEVVAKNEEGLVLKRSDSQYLLGEKSRQKNAAWLKIKPEYNDCTPEIDLLIIAGYIGKGKDYSGQGLAGFLLACRDNFLPGETEDQFKENPRFVPVCQMATFTNPQLRVLREHFENHTTIFAKRDNKWPFPRWFVDRKHKTITRLEREDIPDVTFDPRCSIVVKIKFAAIVYDSKYPGLISAKFPRRVKESELFRDDKDWWQVDSLSRLLEIQAKGNLSREETAEAKLKRRQMEQEKEQGEISSAKSDKQGRKTVPDHFKLSKDVVQSVSSLFDGLKFCLSETFHPITQDSNYGIDFSKRGFEELLKQHGATVSASPEKDSIVLVGTGPENVAVKNIKAGATHDIVTFRYIVDSLHLGKLEEKKPSYYICQTQASRESFRAAGFDALGDHLTVETDEDELRMLLSCLDVNGGENMLGPARGHSKSKPAAVKKPKHEDMKSLLRCQALEEEHREVTKEALLLSKRHWRSIAGGLLVEERNVAESADNVFWVPGNVIYLDLYEALGTTHAVSDGPQHEQKLLKHPSAALLALKYVLPLRGAVLSSSLHVGVTHVVVDPHDSSRFQLMCARRRELRKMACLFERYFVKPSWAERILEDGVYNAREEEDLQDIDR